MGVGVCVHNIIFLQNFPGVLEWWVERRDCLHFILCCCSLESCLQFWVPKHKKDIKPLENIQKRVTKVMKGLEGKPYEKHMRLFGLLSLWHMVWLQGLCCAGSGVGLWQFLYGSLLTHRILQFYDSILWTLPQIHIGGWAAHIAPKSAKQPLSSAGFQTNFFLVLQLEETAVYSSTCQQYQDFQFMQYHVYVS